MFWRFVTHRWTAFGGLCMTVLGIPSILADVNSWLGWYGKVPHAISLTAGVLLLFCYLVANHKRIGIFMFKFLKATRSGCASFTAEFGSPMRIVDWEDLDSIQPASSLKHESDKWSVVEHSARKTSVVGGEAYPVLIGIAKVKELRGERTLYMYVFLHAASSHMELRVEDHHDPIALRRAVLKIDGELFSDMTFEPCLTSTVYDSRNVDDIREEAHHLLSTGDVLSLSITDTLPNTSGHQRQRRHDILRVTTQGFEAAQNKLRSRASSIWSASVRSYSPPELDPSLDPQLLDNAVKFNNDQAAYEYWWRRMAEHFHTNGDEVDQISSNE